MPVVFAAEASGLVGELTGWLSDVSGAWWFLVVIVVIALLDSVVPIVPSETTVIIGGVAAGLGEQNLLLVIAAGAIGAFLGDNLAYLIGARLTGWIDHRAERRPSLRDRLDRATVMIRDRGGLLLVTARFIPGGRTALTISCGVTRQPRRWFAGWVVVAVTIWATYSAVLGSIFGRTFSDNHTLAFLIAFGTALAINVIIEVVRHLRGRAAASQSTAGG
jgi:membrane protein DedA with SNARE-associated domain